MRTDARYVAVEAHALDDLCELGYRAVAFMERGSQEPQLSAALRGALAEVRASAVAEP